MNRVEAPDGERLCLANRHIFLGMLWDSLMSPEAPSLDKLSTESDLSITTREYLRHRYNERFTSPQPNPDRLITEACLEMAFNSPHPGVRTGALIHMQREIYQWHLFDHGYIPGPLQPVFQLHLTGGAPNSFPWQNESLTTLMKSLGKSTGALGENNGNTLGERVEAIRTFGFVAQIALNEGSNRTLQQEGKQLVSDVILNAVNQADPAIQAEGLVAGWGIIANPQIPKDADITVLSTTLEREMEKYLDNPDNFPWMRQVLDGIFEISFKGLGFISTYMIRKAREEGYGDEIHAQLERLSSDLRKRTEPFLTDRATK